MTEERKNEIMSLIEKDETDKITEEEAKEFIDMLAPEEKETVFKINSENMRNRHYKAMQEHENRLHDGYYKKMFYIRRLEWLFNSDIPHEQVYNECKKFVLNFLVEKEPVKVENELANWLECPDCGCQLGKLQPFCANCGRTINTEKEDIWI